MEISKKRSYIPVAILVFCMIGTIQLLLPSDGFSDDANDLLNKWLERQARIESWTADVVQVRKLKSLARPLESGGRVWFKQPNRFRWQLGDPPRTIAVRSADELMVIYPRLKQAERYPIQGVSDPAWKQVLALLEVGFPSDKATFHDRYELLSARRVDDILKLELRPSAKQARRLLEKIRLEIASGDFKLLATELVFPDGSTMKNLFSNHQINPVLDEALFGFDIGEGYHIVEPLKR